MRHIIIGKSPAALSMIFDAISSHRLKLSHEIILVNNLAIPGQVVYKDYEIQQVTTLEGIAIQQNDVFFLGAVMPDTKKALVTIFPLEYNKGTNRWVSVQNWDAVGNGTFVDAHVSVSASAIIGKYVTLYCNSSVNHDCKISDYVTICPNVAVCGNVNIGEGSFIGAGSVIKNDVTIGRGCVIGCGSVVIKDVADGLTVYGNPAK